MLICSGFCKFTYPRRYPSKYLSLEYLNYYHDPSYEKTIALVAGVFENKMEADSARIDIIKFEQDAFIIEAEIYLGCMH